MSGISIEGFAYSGKLRDLNDSAYEHLEKRFATIVPITSNRAALDVISMGYHLVGAQDRVVEAGSDDKQIVLTGHDVKKGDVIRLKTTANTIEEVEIAVRRVIDANTFELEGVLSDVLTAADTFDILRPIAQRYDDTGASLASVVSPPLQFTRDGAATTVTEDTGTPANNRPLPVKLTDITGDINITANDLNVQLSHSAANPDSVQIGDGTEILAINADGSINVNFTATDLDIRDLAASQDNVAISDGTDTLGVNADGSINSVVSATDLDIRDLSASQDSVAISDGTDSLAINGDGSINSVVSATDLDIRNLAPATDAVAISDGVDSLGVNADGSINAVVSATDLDVRDLSASQDNVAISDGTDTLAVNADGSINATVSATDLDVRDLSHTQDSIQIGDGTDLLAINADGSINVSTSGGGKSAVDFLRNDYTSTNVTTGAFVELKAALAQQATAIEIFDSSGQTLELATGSGGSEVVFMRVFPGGNGYLPITLAAATRISIRAVSADATVGEININFYQ